MADNTAPKKPRAKSLSIEPYSRAQIRLDALALAVRVVERAPLKQNTTAATITTSVINTHKKLVDAIFPDEVS